MNFTLIRTFLVLTCSLFFILDGIAQHDFRPGYIVTKDSVTIDGEIDFRKNLKNYESCLYKKGKDVIEYTPDMILGYGFLNDRYYQTDIVEDYFVEVIIEGKLNLYKFKDYYIVQKEDEKYDLKSIIVEKYIDDKKGKTEEGKWKGYLIFLTNDCEKNLKSQIASSRFNEQSITKIVKKYNECFGDEVTFYKEDKKSLDFNFGVIAGYTTYTINIPVKNNAFRFLADDYESSAVEVGGLISFSSPRINEKLFFDLEFHYRENSFSNLVVLDQGSEDEYFEVFIDLKTLVVPMSLRYDWVVSKNVFLLQFGTNFEFNFDSGSRLYSEFVFNNSVRTEPVKEAININGYMVGAFAGLGYKRSFNKFQSGILLRYTYMSDLSSSMGFVANNYRTSISLIFQTK